MKAAVLRAPRDLRVEAATDPAPSAGEALLRGRAAGVCGTDFRIWAGDRPVRYPLIMGHEFIGDVVAVGPGVLNVKPGDAVAVEPNYSCGACALCREGNRNLCLSRTAVGIDVDGGFAELGRIPARGCWPAPPGLRPHPPLPPAPPPARRGACRWAGRRAAGRDRRGAGGRHARASRRTGPESAGRARPGRKPERPAAVPGPRARRRGGSPPD